MLGQLVGEIFAGSARRKQRKHEKALQDEAYRKDLEMWQRQNEYNLPSAQMQRFRDAGLNPNLIYGQGSPGNASEMPRYQAPRAQYGVGVENFTGLLGQYQNFQLMQAQIQKTRNEGRKAEEEANFANAFFKYRAAEQGHKFDERYENYRKKFYDAEIMKETYWDQVKRIRNTAGKVGLDRAFRARELSDYQDYGVRPQDPVYIRLLLDWFEKTGIIKGGKLMPWKIKPIFGPRRK